MHQQNNADDSMNFSIIDRNHAPPNLDFSAHSLLADPPISHQPPPIPPLTHTEPPILTRKERSKASGCQPTPPRLQAGQTLMEEGFLRDLSRMEKELSFQTELHNIYEQQVGSSIEGIQANKSKTLSCLRATKEFTNKSISKDMREQDYNHYYGPLVLDFRCVATPSHLAHSNVASSEQSYTRKNKKTSQLKGFYRTEKGQPKSRPPFEDGRRSKSKSVANKLGMNATKSQKHLKTSAQTDAYASKVFNEYYGTDLNFHPRKPSHPQPKKKKQLTTLRSTEKPSKSRPKLTLLSPRDKLPPPTGPKRQQR